MAELGAIKQAFLESAVRVVARDGLENTTTKVIAREAGFNEAYIYKCFSGKDELLSQAMLMEDINFAHLLLDTLPVMKMPEFSWKERAYLLWKRSWNFILQEPDDCIFYIRYYYSASCRIHAYERHQKSYKAVVEKIRPAFKDGTHMDLLLHQIFSTMLFFAHRVMNHELENNEQTTEWAFEQIYSFVIPNVRPEFLN